MVLNILAHLDPGPTGFEHSNSTSSELDAIAAEAHTAYRDERCSLEGSQMREAVQVYADQMLESIREGSAPIPSLLLATRGIPTELVPQRHHAGPQDAGIMLAVSNASAD